MRWTRANVAQAGKRIPTPAAMGYRARHVETRRRFFPVLWRLLSRSGAALLGALVVVLGVATLVFLLLHLAPGDPVEAMLGETASGADRAALRAELGLDAPLPVQYARYLEGLATLDLGIPPEDVLIWYGVLYTITCQIAYLTPPFGYNLFLMRAFAPPEITMGDIYRSVVPFVLVMVLALGLLMAFPGIALWLPNLIYPN